MAVGKRDITIVRGDDYTHVVTLNTRTAGVLTPVNITGRTYTAQIRKNKTQDSVDATLTCSVTDAVNGEITITLANTTTTNLRPGTYYWDLQQNASGVRNTILRGKAEVVSDVTR
jgi:hypothetical protein